jgi:hypothetical protein
MALTLFLQRAVQRMKDEELQKKREEAERKARRGEIDPTHEFTFLLIGQVKQFGLWKKIGQISNYQISLMLNIRHTQNINLLFFHL